MNTAIQIHCACCGGTRGIISIRNLKSVYSEIPRDIALCNNCGNMITLPPPDRETLEKIYSSDYLYPVHLMALGEKKYRAKNFATFLKSQTPSHSKPKLLEAGCMYGYLLEDLSEIFDTEGIEISNDAVQHCQSTGLNVSNTSLENFLSIETGKYDIIILSHVFEHLVDPYACLEKMKNILRENGCIYLLVPNNRSFLRKISGRYWGWWQVPVHVNHFNRSALEKMANRAGMKVDFVRYRGGDSLMLLLTVMNIFGFRGKGKAPGIFQKRIIQTVTRLFRYWYHAGNEELTVRLKKYAD